MLRPSRARADRARLRLARRPARPRARPAAERRACRCSPRTSRRPRAAPTSIFLCLGNEQAAAFEPPGRRRSWSISAACTGSPTQALAEQWYGLDARRLELRAARGASRRGPPDREPRLLRDRDAARALAAARRDRRRRRRRREVGDDRRRAARCRDCVARGRGARELLAVRRRRPPPRARDRADARPARSASCRTCCRCAAGCSRPVTCAPDADVRGAARGGVRRAAPSCACCPRASSPRSRASRGPTRPRSASSPTAATGHVDRDLRRRQPRQGRRRAGGAEREPRARAARDRRAAARGACWCEGHGERHRCEGLRRLGRRRPGSGGATARTSRSSARCRTPSARRCSRATACRPPACR